MNEISNQNKKPDNFIDIYNYSNNNTTEIFMVKGTKSPQSTGSSKVAQTNIKLELSTIFDTATASTLSDLYTNQIKLKKSISLQKGKKLLKADKLLSEEDEIISEIFDVPHERVIPEHEMNKDEVSQMKRILMSSKSANGISFVFPINA